MNPFPTRASPEPDLSRVKAHLQPAGARILDQAPCLLVLSCKGQVVIALDIVFSQVLFDDGRWDPVPSAAGILVGIWCPRDGPAPLGL